MASTSSNVWTAPTVQIPSKQQVIGALERATLAADARNSEDTAYPSSKYCPVVARLTNLLECIELRDKTAVNGWNSISASIEECAATYMLDPMVISALKVGAPTLAQEETEPMQATTTEPTTATETTEQHIPTIAFIDAAVIREAVNSVPRAASKDGSRPVLAAVHVVFSERNNDITVEAADGFRAHKLWVKRPGGNNGGHVYQDVQFLIPAADFSNLKALGTKGLVRVELDAERVIWNGDAGEIITPRLTGQNYVDLNRVIPTDYTLRMVLKVAELKAALKAISAQARDTGNIVRFIAEGDTLYLETGPDNGVNARSFPDGVNHLKLVVVAVRALETEQNMPHNAVALNHRYVLDVLNATKEKEIELTMTPQKGGPAKFAAGNMLAVVMPMYLANSRGATIVEPAYRPAPLAEQQADTADTATAEVVTPQVLETEQNTSTSTEPTSTEPQPQADASEAVIALAENIDQLLRTTGTMFNSVDLAWQYSDTLADDNGTPTTVTLAPDGTYRVMHIDRAREVVTAGTHSYVPVDATDASEDPIDKILAEQSARREAEDLAVYNSDSARALRLQTQLARQRSEANTAETGPACINCDGPLDSDGLCPVCNPDRTLVNGSDDNSEDSPEYSTYRDVDLQQAADYTRLVLESGLYAVGSPEYRNLISDALNISTEQRRRKESEDTTDANIPAVHSTAPAESREDSSDNSEDLDAQMDAIKAEYTRLQAAEDKAEARLATLRAKYGIAPEQVASGYPLPGKYTRACSEWVKALHATTACLERQGELNKRVHAAKQVKQHEAPVPTTDHELVGKQVRTEAGEVFTVDYVETRGLGGELYAVCGDNGHGTKALKPGQFTVLEPEQTPAQATPKPGNNLKDGDTIRIGCDFLWQSLNGRGYYLADPTDQPIRDYSKWTPDGGYAPVIFYRSWEAADRAAQKLYHKLEVEARREARAQAKATATAAK